MLTRLCFLFVFSFSLSHAQHSELLTSFSIPSNLIKDANAIVRQDDIAIEIKAYNKMLYTNQRIVTILNSFGDNKHGAVMYYDENINIKKLEAKVYDALGNEIKKIRKNDFEDVSAVSGGTLFSDSRVKYLKYVPIKYPYTIVFDTEVEYNSTGFIPGWRPIEGYFTSTENANYKIINSTQIPVKIKTSHFETYGIETSSDYEFSVKNLESIKPEILSPDFSSFTPLLKATLTEFEMEGVKGTNKDWSDFGKWMNDQLIQGTQELPEKVKKDIQLLTADANTNLEKAKIVYQYMQNKTRYISVQIGIGGWKPMLAGDVDRLGYGDCKGLSNYTKAMLDEVGVQSHYAIIYGDNDIRNIDKSFSSIQGNHAVLCIPSESDYVWLECTSQTTPFGYNANFTDDRDALIITPEGGKIVHTTIYKTEGNILDTNSSIVLSEAGDITASLTTKSYGTQYGFHEGIQNQSLKDQKLKYKEDWGYINGLDIVSTAFENNKDEIVFTENVDVQAQRYAIKTGSRLLLQPNLFNRTDTAPKRYEERTTPFVIERGYTHTDQYEIVIPNTMEVEVLLEPTNIINKFGEYTTIVSLTEGNKILYQRKLVIEKGSYDKEDYDAYRNFLLEVVKNDNSKIVLKTKT
ncbi:MAG: DUF3857 domain-containing protein [Aquaticitalea sp.]